MMHFHPEPSLLEPLREVLSASAVPNWTLVQCDRPATRNAYLGLCAEALEAYEHLVVDLAEIQITSLVATLQDKLPEPLFRTTGETYVIHLTGLESSFLEEIMAGESLWVPALEAEKEGLLHEFPFAFVVWTDAYTADKLQREAPGFYVSMNLKMTFSSPGGETQNSSDSDEESQSRQWEVALEKIQTETAAVSPDSGEYARLRYLTGNIFFDHSRWELAAGFFRDVIGLEETEISLPWIAKSYRALGAAYANKGEIEPGIEALETAAERLEVLELYEELGRCFQSLARIYRAVGASAETLQNHLYAAEAYREAGMAKEAGDQLRTAAHLYEEKGKAAKALSMLNTSLQDFERAGALHEQALGYQHIGVLHQKEMQWAEALKAFQLALPLAMAEKNDFLVESLEDSIRDMQDQMSPKPTGKKGLFGRLFGS
jgi:DNA-binding transcriptional ArsR family regulator